LASILAQRFEIPRIEGTHTDGAVLVFALVVSLVTGLVFGVVFTPVGAASDLEGGLREAGRTAAGGPGGRRLRSLLVVLEAALALVLPAAAGLLLENFLALRATPPGFDAHNVLTMGLSLPKTRMAEPPARLRYMTDLLERAAALPGVASA